MLESLICFDDSFFCFLFFFFYRGLRLFVIGEKSNIEIVVEYISWFSVSSDCFRISIKNLYGIGLYI